MFADQLTNFSDEKKNILTYSTTSIEGWIQIVLLLVTTGESSPSSLFWNTLLHIKK